MKTVLLCGYRPQESGENQGQLLDQRIRELRELKYDILCVLGGSEADGLLLQSKLLHEVDICFDTSPQPSLMSNARAGICAASGEAVFVLPMEVPAPEKPVWDFLKNEHGKAGFATEHGFLQTSSASYRFPLLITVKGSKRLENAEDFESFVDTRWNPLIF